MASSKSFSPGSAQPRWATPATPGRPNLAGKVAWTAAALGFGGPGFRGLMGHQRLIIGTATERLPGGLPAFRQVVIEEPRQQGKSVSTLSLMVTAALDQPGMMITYSAQTRKAGRKRMLDVWWPLIRKSPLRKLVKPRRTFGAEAFLFANGSMIMLASGTETADHGDTLHLAVIDEAWAQRDDTIEQAVKPAMMTIDGAQLWIVSTAGTEFSAYFRGKVDDGRAMAELGVTDTSAYFGYSAPDDADPADPATWYGCMPALGVTVSEGTVAADFATMDLAEFRRAYLCQWPEIAKPGWEVISQQAWEAVGNG
jgi:phage terminase large subunit-like protein